MNQVDKEGVKKDGLLGIVAKKFKEASDSDRVKALKGNFTDMVKVVKDYIKDHPKAVKGGAAVTTIAIISAIAYYVYLKNTRERAGSSDKKIIEAGTVNAPQAGGRRRRRSSKRKQKRRSSKRKQKRRSKRRRSKRRR